MAEYDLDKIVSNIIDANDSTWNPHEKIPLITEQIERIKADTESYLTSNDIDVASLLEEAEELNAEGMQLVDDMEACKVDIVEVTTSEMTKYMENYYLMAQEIYGNYYVINIVNDVLKYVTYINDYSRAKDERRYTNAVEALSGFARDIESPIDGMENLHVYINAKGLVKAGYGVLYETLAKEWEKMITCQTSTLNDELVITIALPVTETPATADILAALLLSNKIDEYVSNFANFILKEALIPIIEKQCRVEIRDEIELVVHVPTKGDDKPDFPTVMNNLETVFRFLETRLNIIYHENENKNFITTVGDCIKADFCEHLINNCFVQTIPHNLNDLHDYSTITAKIENFYDFLIKSNFIKSSDNISLLKYMAEFDVLFAERSSDYYLDAARKIMLKDLSITMSIGVESIPKAEESAMCDDDVDVQAQACQIIAEMIPTSLFYFPRCMISRSAQELLDLVYVVMEQAVQCPDVVCKKLYVTVRLIFELYDAVVPYHHENFLQTIPQYVALFHNNCMYLAHNLMLLGEKWMNHMGERQVNYPVSFLDLVPKMRELGYKHLTIHMQQQRKQILDNIRSSDLNCIDVKDVLDENAEAAVRQCLRQLQLLKNVWIGVFPHNVFTRLMATLVNMFIDELIHRVCTVEDISMEMAVQLTDMYTLVAQKAPGLFQKQNDIEKEVKSWSKLQELIFVLGASLKDIESHWGDGSGPLAKHFRIEEIRSLIKALFQNTQYRANLISKIK